MIRLIGVLSEGGISVQIRSNLATKGDMLLGALIEATRALSSTLSSGSVMKLDFRDQKLILTESEKGYSIVALVDKAEDYMDTLIRIIAEDIDNSRVPKADGSVTDLHKDIVEAILDSYIKHEVDVTLSDSIEKVWTPIFDALKQDPTYVHMIDDLDRTVETANLEDRWSKLVDETDKSIKNALWYAQSGEFDKACAACIGLDSLSSKLFSIKMGTLAFSMTRTYSPPLEQLQTMTETLPDDTMSQLARAVVGRLTKEVSSIDYNHSYKHALDSFELIDDEDHLLQAFLLVDVLIAEHPKSTGELASFFKKHGFDVISNYITAIVERDTLFQKLYSMTSYDHFKSDLGLWKIKIADTIDLLESVLNPEKMEGKIVQGAIIKSGQTGSLQLQNYITLLTAIAESPVLSIGERRGILREVITLYNGYFRKLLVRRIPIFTYTVDSVLQSLSVAYAEYYHLTTGDARERTLAEIVDFLHDIATVLEEEWVKLRGRFSLDVFMNAISPVLAMAGELHHDEIKLILAAMKTLEIRDIDAQRILDPMTFATNLGNIMSALASLASRVLGKETRTVVLREAISHILTVHQFFITSGLVCRDDIISATYHVSEATELLSERNLRRIMSTISVLNRVSIQDMTIYDYEVAMMGYPLLKALVSAWKQSGDITYRETAKITLDIAITAWRKYGFHDKALEFEKEFGEIKKIE